MVWDQVIERLKIDFTIEKPEDWGRIKPSWILERRGVGEGCLNHIRLWLAIRGITLEDDATPEYWKERLGESRIGHQMGTGYDTDAGDVLPFTILVDSMEQHPFTFEGLRGDADRDYRPLIVPKEYKALGAGRGDYSLAGYEGRCHIERKSLEDAHGTFLGWGKRRDRFERTLDFLSQIECGAVVIECSFGVLCASVQSRGQKTKQENAKILHRQLLAWQQDFRVPFIPCDNRRFAEKTTFRIIERFWRKQMEAAKAADKRPHANGDSKPAPVKHDPINDETAPINVVPADSLF